MDRPRSRRRDRRPLSSAAEVTAVTERLSEVLAAIRREGTLPRHMEALLSLLTESRFLVSTTALNALLDAGEAAVQWCYHGLVSDLLESRPSAREQAVARRTALRHWNRLSLENLPAVPLLRRAQACRLFERHATTGRFVVPRQCPDGRRRRRRKRAYAIVTGISGLGDVSRAVVFYAEPALRAAYSRALRELGQ